MQPTIDYALHLDAIDSFSPLTHLFDMPIAQNGQPLIYLNGNSLGPKPKNIEQAFFAHCQQWGRLGIRGYFDCSEPWISYSECVNHSLARLVGACVEEVGAMGTLTANLHALFISFYHPTPERFKIICLEGFPSDSYAIDAQVKQRLKTIQSFSNNFPDINEVIIKIKPNAEGHIPLEVFKQILAVHGNSTAIIWIEAVHYLTGQYFDVAAIAQLAHHYGCKIGLDLAHAIANVPLALSAWDIDFAVWCHYKYVSAGPGAIGGFYVHKKYFQSSSLIRLAGWWGHNKNTRFLMPEQFGPIMTAAGWQMSTPPIFLLAALRYALNIFDQIDLLDLREKNNRLVAYLEYLINRHLADKIKIITPANPQERGCQLSLKINTTLPNNKLLEKIFLTHGVVVDVRGSLVRVAPMGLYTTFKDVFCFVEKLTLIFGP